MRIILESDMPYGEFQKALSMFDGFSDFDKSGGDFNLIDAIIWEMDYGESAKGGKLSEHNGIVIRFEE